MNSVWMSWARTPSDAAATMAVGWPLATSWAKDGPAQDANRISSERGHDLRHSQEAALLDALAGADEDLVAGEQGRDGANVPRRCCEGVTQRMTSASKMAAGRSPVIWTSAGTMELGR